MAETNKIIGWAVEALTMNNFKLPDDELIRQAFLLTGLPSAELESGMLQVGKSNLKSIFSEVNLKLQGSKQPDPKWYKWQPLNPGEMPVPVEIDGLKAPEVGQFVELVNKNMTNFNLNDEQQALSFIEIYGSYLSVSPEKPFLSFYDCVKTAAALYSCLEKNDGKAEFLLIGGDLNGIQSYLFNMSESQSKGVAKILRARSFNLGLFTDICRHFILHELGLPFHCTIVDAGGRFILIVPDKNELVPIIQKVQKEINEFCIKEYYGALSLNLSYEIGLSQEDLLGNKLSEKIAELNCSLENQKYQIFKTNLQNGEWDTKNFYLDHEYDLYENDVCKISGKLPKNIEGDDGISNEFEFNKKLGQKLVKTECLGFEAFKGNMSKIKSGFYKDYSFKSKTYVVHFLESSSHPGNNFYRIENLTGGIKKNCVPRYFANYVPKYDKNLNEERERYFPFQKFPEFSMKNDLNKQREQKSETEHEKDWLKAGNVMDFGTLAYAGMNKAEKQTGDSQQQYIGSDLLGVIKADVDRMGHIFTNGIQHIFSLATYASLSRQLDLFFTAYLPDIQEKQYPWVYTVYAGGDDLFFIGEWQEAIKFAQTFYQKFRDYTGKNRDLTISTGIYIMPPSHPIRTAAEIAEELLEKAKDNNRDSIAIFDIVVKQEKLAMLVELGEFLYEKQKAPAEQSNVNSGFLHRLLKYREMALSYVEESKIEGLIYIPRLIYDLSRNIIEKNRETKEIMKGSDEIQKLQMLTDSVNIDKIITAQLPVCWSILKNRKLVN